MPSLLWRENKEELISKRRILLFSVSSCGTHLFSFFTFPMAYRCRETVELWIFVLTAISRTVRRESSSTMSFKILFTITVGLWPPGIFSRSVSPERNFQPHCDQVWTHTQVNYSNFLLLHDQLKRFLITYTAQYNRNYGTRQITCETCTFQMIRIQRHLHGKVLSYKPEKFKL